MTRLSPKIVTSLEEVAPASAPANQPPEPVAPGTFGIRLFKKLGFPVLCHPRHFRHAAARPSCQDIPLNVFVVHLPFTTSARTCRCQPRVAIGNVSHFKTFRLGREVLQSGLSCMGPMVERPHYGYCHFAVARCANAMVSQPAHDSGDMIQWRLFARCRDIHERHSSAQIYGPESWLRQQPESRSGSIVPPPSRASSFRATLQR